MSTKGKPKATLSHDFLSLALERQHESLEREWEESLEDPGELEPYCQTIVALCEQDMASKALALASLMVEALAEKARPKDAALLALTVVRKGAHNENLARRLVELYEQTQGQEPWFGVLKELARLDAETVTAEALDKFEKLLHYTVGHVLYHRAGWGEGVVEEFLPQTREIVVNFTKGAKQQIPLKTAIESMKPLAAGDLRSMILLEPERLAELAKEQPSVLITKAARIFRGRITRAQVKGALSPRIVPAKRWASFWKRAKAAAMVDPWLRVEGSTTRPVFILRKRPLSLAEEAQRALQHADDLGQAIGICRHYLDRCADRTAKDLILNMAGDRVATALTRGSGVSHAHVLEGVLLLEEHGKEAPTSAASELREMLLGEDGVFRPESFNLLPTLDARIHAVGLLKEALGEGWVDACVRELPRFPPAVIESVVTALEAAGQAVRLIELWDRVAPYPRRQSMLTYMMGRLYADGVFDGVAEKPVPATVGRVLLHLARVLAGERRGNAELTRLQTRLVSLLTGRRRFLARILDEVDYEMLRDYLGIAERGGADFPQEIHDRILRTIARRYPDMLAEPEKPFWEQDYIFTTQAGLARQQEAYHQIVDVDMPRNSEAIGNAAALGDLSENSEWDAAMEEQRKLTGRAEVMSQDLRKAKLLEEETIPEGTVAPGTQVSFTVISSGQSRTMRLLGPWDTNEDGVLNYQAPAGKRLLGKAIGDVTTLPGEHGDEQVRIEAISKIV